MARIARSSDKLRFDSYEPAIRILNDFGKYQQPNSNVYSYVACYVFSGALTIRINTLFRNKMLCYRRRVSMQQTVAYAAIGCHSNIACLPNTQHVVAVNYEHVTNTSNYPKSLKTKGKYNYRERCALLLQSIIKVTAFSSMRMVPAYRTCLQSS